MLRSFNSLIILQCHPVVPKLELVGARLELVGARSVVVEKHGYRMAPRSFQILATMTKMSGSSSSQ
jgi:hypothetical protein